MYLFLLLLFFFLYYLQTDPFHQTSDDYVHNMSNYANILELQTWIIYQRVAIECAGCLCKFKNYIITFKYSSMQHIDFLYRVVNINTIRRETFVALIDS